MNCPKTPTKIAMALGLVFAALTGSGCGVTLLTWDQEIAMGIESQPAMVEQFGGEVPDPDLRAFTTGVGQDLLAGVDEDVPEDIPWEFTMLNSDVINAFALPGGKVFMTRGLSSQLENEAEFAAVIGHEIGHVTARHGNKRISSQIGFNVALIGAGIAVGVADSDSDLRKYGQYGVPALAVGGNLLLLKYGRNEELEADRLGVKYMVAAGYDPLGARGVQELLKEASAGSSRPPEILSTHPAGDTRIKRITDLLQGDYAYTQNNPEYSLYEDRYQSQVLTKLNALGMAPHPPIRGVGRFSLADTASWCSHCAELQD